LRGRDVRHIAGGISQLTEGLEIPARRYLMVLIIEIIGLDDEGVRDLAVSCCNAVQRAGTLAGRTGLFPISMTGVAGNFAGPITISTNDRAAVACHARRVSIRAIAASFRKDFVSCRVLIGRRVKNLYRFLSGHSAASMTVWA
jgi:hypothetical protein